MRAAVLLLLLPLPLLAGCSMDWDHLLSFGSGSDRAEVTQAAASVPPPAPPPAPASNDFCRGVARQDATTNGFDAATQARVAQRSYQQCVAVFADAQAK